MKAAKVNAGLAESNGKLLPGLWRELLHVTCGLTACTPGSSPGPTLGNEYGKTLPLGRRGTPEIKEKWKKSIGKDGQGGKRQEKEEGKEEIEEGWWTSIYIVSCL